VQRGRLQGDQAGQLLGGQLADGLGHGGRHEDDRGRVGLSFQGAQDAHHLGPEALVEHRVRLVDDLRGGAPRRAGGDRSAHEHAGETALLREEEWRRAAGDAAARRGKEKKESRSARQPGDVAQEDAFLLHVLREAGGRGDDEVDGARQRLALLPHRRVGGQAGGAELGHVAQLLGDARDLLRQLLGGPQDDGARAARPRRGAARRLLLRLQRVHYGQQVGQRLAGAGVRGQQVVAAAQQRRHRQRLRSGRRSGAGGGGRGREGASAAGSGARSRPGACCCCCCYCVCC
jgi:hypothetical protein